MIQRYSLVWDDMEEDDDKGAYVLYADHLAAVRELVEALQDIADDYADRFDINNRSTNPGIKNVIVRARAAIAKATEGEG